MGTSAARDDLALDLNRFRQEIEAMGLGAEEYGEEVEITMQMCLDVVEQAIVDRTPVNLGLLRGGMATEIYGKPFSGFYGQVVNPLPYASVVEYGRKPGKLPPVDAIAYWVKRKGLLGRVSRRGGAKIEYKNRRGQVRQTTVAKAEMDVAWAIAIHIQKHGTAGSHMFGIGLEVSRPAVYKLWDELLSRLVRRIAQSGGTR